MPPTTSCAEYFRVKSKRRHEERQQAAKMQKLAADVETNMATIVEKKVQELEKTMGDKMAAMMQNNRHSVSISHQAFLM